MKHMPIPFYLYPRPWSGETCGAEQVWISAKWMEKRDDKEGNEGMSEPPREVKWLFETRDVSHRLKETKEEGRAQRLGLT